MPQYVRLGMTQAASLRAFKSAGYGVRRQTMQQVYREFAGVAKTQDAFRATGRSRVLSDDAYAKMPLPAGREVKVKGILYTRDTRTGQIGEQWVTLYDQKRDSKEAYEQAFVKQFGEDMLDSEREFITMSFLDAWENEETF